MAADAAFEALEPLSDETGAPGDDLWLQAAFLGPADPRLRRAAIARFAAAERALARRDGDGQLAARLAEFAERYPERGRCPADDQLDALGAGLHPLREEQEPEENALC
ncbi:hypothetical protein OG905_09070 [Streptomyces sp. NBC_00322]|uniref:hypothetical protein n=1 Tax=Streptomyces sp. NBC_00322 TaxID=2975712 RepID=UPI002E28A155|nr:hypothetical protein [Streptomyces sp. NBC_00322]